MDGEEVMPYMDWYHVHIAIVQEVGQIALLVFLLHLCRPSHISLMDDLAFDVAQVSPLCVCLLE